MQDSDHQQHDNAAGRLSLGGVYLISVTAVRNLKGTVLGIFSGPYFRPLLKPTSLSGPLKRRFGV